MERVVKFVIKESFLCVAYVSPSSLSLAFLILLQASHTFILLQSRSPEAIEHIEHIEHSKIFAQFKLLHSQERSHKHYCTLRIPSSLYARDQS